MVLKLPMRLNLASCIKMNYQSAVESVGFGILAYRFLSAERRFCIFIMNVRYHARTELDRPGVLL